ncbi:NUDIX hydrolase [Chloroflexota bacterium]
MIQQLKEALSNRHRKDLFTKRRRRVVGNPTASAVLLPLFMKDEECHVLFTKRTTAVRDHKGQISFPGGANELVDVTLLDTALRESKEEIGLDAGAVDIIGDLDEILTLHTNYLISPFVGVIPWPYQFKVDSREVEEIIEVPIPALLDKNNLRHETETDEDGKMIIGYYYDYKGHVIWGATARILTQFLDIWRQVAKEQETGL